MAEKVMLYHGDGGKHTNIMINELFYKYYSNEILLQGNDSAVFQVENGRMAFTTDSFVIKPVFFSGGNIGGLSVCGTVNDLAVSGAKPLYLSAGFIIEEGFDMSELESIIKEMGRTCQKIGVKIITGDTKVVEKGSIDGIFINTSGIGVIENKYEPKRITPGDHIIITGSLAEHGAAIAIDRYNIKAKGDFYSDCASVYNIIKELIPYYHGIKLMRDPTRGGLATALNEIATAAGIGIRITEAVLPIRREVMGICSLLGIDPLYLASEGRAILIVDPGMSKEIVMRIKGCENGNDACVIGSFTDNKESLVYMETSTGGKRILQTLDMPMIPRIC
jgi:hydrogenase expression/formation protein HypE